MTEDERLRRELRSLPRESASDDFTPRLMRRLQEQATGEAERRGRSGRTIPWSQAWAAAALLLLLAAGWQALRSGSPSPETVAAPERVGAVEVGPPVQRVSSRRELEREAASVRRELERLRRLAAVRDSVIAIPGSGDYDYYIDLRPVLEEGSGRGSGVDRALYRPGGQRGTARRGERP